MKVKNFSENSLMSLTEEINRFFNTLEDYAIWHISNIIETVDKNYHYFKILIFYDEEVEDLSK